MKNYTIEQLKEMVQEVNSWDGSLENFEYMEMESINDYLYNIEPLEVLRMAHFGDFNWNDEMCRINTYENLESCSKNDFECELIDNKKEIVGRYNELVEVGNIEKMF